MYGYGNPQRTMSAIRAPDGRHLSEGLRPGQRRGTGRPRRRERENVVGYICVRRNSPKEGEEMRMRVEVRVRAGRKGSVLAGNKKQKVGTGTCCEGRSPGVPHVG